MGPKLPGPMVGPKLTSHQHGTSQVEGKSGNLGSPVLGAGLVWTCTPTFGVQVLVPEKDPQLTNKSYSGQTYIENRKDKKVTNL